MTKVCFRYISKKDRDALPDSAFGYVSGDRRLFPIIVAEDVMSASKLIGRAKGLTAEDKSKIKAKIVKIAKEKEFAIPETWIEEGFSSHYDTTDAVTISNYDSY